MFAGSEEGLNRRPLVSLSVIAGAMRLFKAPNDFPKGENNDATLLLSCGILTLISIHDPTSAWAQEAKGKNCRMEQQCRWENFKKICTWVKVCR